MILETITSIGLYITDKLAEKLIQDKFTNWTNKFKKPLKEELTDIIYRTQDEFLKKYPEQKKYKKGKVPFWGSQIIIDELLEYRYYNKKDFSGLINKLKENKNIVIPAKDLLDDFLKIFSSIIENDQKLKEIEREIGYKERIFSIDEKVNESNAKLDLIIQSLEEEDNKKQNQTINSIQINDESSKIFFELSFQLISVSQEYKRQLDICEENINKLKPQTALDWLLKLESEIEKNSNTTSVIKSNLYYLEAVCYETLQENPKAWELYIKAYNLNKSLFFRERAAFSYLYLYGIDSALELAAELLKEEENNVYGWFINTVNHYETNFGLLDSVPKIVWSNLKFKKLIFGWFNNKNNQKFVKLVVDSINDTELHYSQEKLNREGFYTTNFFFHIALLKFFYSTKVVFLNRVVQSNELVNLIVKLTDKLLQTLIGTEISKHFLIINFYNSYFRIIENGSESELIAELKTSYKNLKNTNPQTLLQYLSILYPLAEYDLIIEETNNFQGDKNEDILHLLAFSYVGKRDSEKSKDAFLNYADTIDTIHEWNIINLLSICDYLPYKEYLNLIIEKTNSKPFTNQFFKTLLQVYFDCINPQNKGELLKIIDVLINLNEFEHLRFYIANCYFKLHEYKSCIEFLNTYLDKENESAELYVYIHCLSKSKTNHVELLKLLKQWRINFSFDIELHAIKADLRRQIPDLDEIERISENALSNVPENEYFLNLYILTIEKLGKKEKISNYLVSIKDKEFENLNFAINIAGSLLRCQYFQEGIDIIYKYAVKKGNTNIREFYFTSSIIFPKGYLNEYEKVEEGHYVKYRILGKSKIIHIVNGTFSNKQWAKELLNKNIGDKISTEFGQVEIVRIMNKYLALYDEILDEVDERDEGYNIESFKLPDSEDIKKINKFFIQNFGMKEEERERQKQNIVDEYILHKKSFSELNILLNEGDWVKTYSFLTSKSANGFNSAPSYYFQQYNLENKRIIIEPTSLMLFFSLSKELGLEFRDYFTIPLSLIYRLKEAIKKIEIEPNSRMSLHITSKSLYPQLYPQDFKSKRLQYYNELLEWIEKHCRSVKNEKKLDIIMNLEKDGTQNIFLNDLIDNVSLNSDENTILISDDLFFYRFFNVKSGKILNTELFLFQYFPDKKEQISEFLLKKKYLGISINKDILLDEFFKKLAQKENDYLQCLLNINIKNYANPAIIYECIGFLKLIAIKPLITPETYIKEAMSIFIYLFKGIEVSSTKFILMMKYKIQHDFKILGYYADYTLKAFSDAMNILNVKGI